MVPAPNVKAFCHCLLASTTPVEKSILILDPRYVTVFFSPEPFKTFSLSLWGQISQGCILVWFFCHLLQDLVNSFNMENHVGQLGIFLILFLWQHPLLHSLTFVILELLVVGCWTFWIYPLMFIFFSLPSSICLPFCFTFQAIS